MRFLIRWLFRFLILGVVLVAALLLTKDALLKSYIEHRLRSQTGMDVQIGQMELGLFSPTLRLADLVIFNPAEFGGSPLIHMAELRVEYDPVALSRRQLSFPLVRLNLAEVNVVRNQAGKSNFEYLQEKTGVGIPSSSDPGAWEFQKIEVLNLTVGRVRFTDMKNPARPNDWNVGLRNEILKNIQSVQDLYGSATQLMVRQGLSTVLSNSVGRGKR
jgi:uncharacterized protein involved in outer membrane biogenesis